jgi:hypothetical protein
MILAAKTEGKRPLAKPRHSWGDDIGIELREITRSVMDWIYLAQDRDQRRDLANTVMNIWVP